MAQQNNINALIGLGNPGPKFALTRHNIGFRILDALAEKHGASWHTKGNAEVAQITINDRSILLVKPLTFMNSSGQVLPQLAKQGIKKENILVVHDELELPFGKLKVRTGGSAKGHNGLRSIIETIGPEFMRLSVGIDRPANREEVPDYVLTRFREDEQAIEHMIQQAVVELEKIIS
ncbi:MAG: Peptidyl-tRNA hydrolase [Candidatus Dependentiae bacterium ADurb.Bin331]|nr:MAG: Peptidyl-tRNA hydrolase [Candidatus Dependentiae bacterium ADurb.Bin331]